MYLVAIWAEPAVSSRGWCSVCPFPACSVVILGGYGTSVGGALLVEVANQGPEFQIYFILKSLCIYGSAGCLPEGVRSSRSWMTGSHELPDAAKFGHSARAVYALTS